MNKGRSHGVILGKWGKESQTKLGRLVFIINLSVHVLTPRGYRLAECICDSAGWGLTELVNRLRIWTAISPI